MPIAQAHVERIAGLARLKLTPLEQQSFTKDLSQIVTYMDMLAEIDTDFIEISAPANRATNLRADGPEPSLSASQALANAGKTKDGFFIVPRVL
ncbi:MAG: Asp-tRNA(Asn)/Glu-tRNA(Gln) amidotransferase subunit GatC [Candidatus Zixiibacteriota bacterium]